MNWSQMNTKDTNKRANALFIVWFALFFSAIMNIYMGWQKLYQPMNIDGVETSPSEALLPVPEIPDLSFSLLFSPPTLYFWIGLACFSIAMLAQLGLRKRRQQMSESRTSLHQEANMSTAQKEFFKNEMPLFIMSLALSDATVIVGLLAAIQSQASTWLQLSAIGIFGLLISFPGTKGQSQ